MLKNLWKQQDVSHMSPNSIALEAPLVASPNQTMRAIQVSRKKLYELINSGELESYTEGKSRRITIKSINEYIERRLATEAIRRGRTASARNHQSRP
ncbi:helix-turn-helix domain-containing protein [Bradyrhizobium sp. CCGUVB23]|uniref:helix-turn-helix domain-containing protein n=1 Tax=Bradyrhizobium sp. CCGUVB23 TaxID=2949630 RepID=UPI0020B231F0|nr:helix-turn-helix domain-containing protein [Bradyrhizobium sp. CCGUVB23]MCP3461886.1 helix-turn-helix domain-containing protein [Bradyrhizobium sp. CCGUVB23]